MPVQKYTLKPIQDTLYSQVAAQLEKFDESSLIAGTGIGKTIIAAHTAAAWATVFNPTVNGKSKKWSTVLNPRQIVFLVHRDTLVDQTIDKFQQVFRSRYHHQGLHEEFGMDGGIGLIKGSEVYNPTKPIVVASIQSLRRRYKKLFSQRLLTPQMLMYDEAHTNLFSNTGRGILEAGLHEKLYTTTATPFRLEKNMWYGQLVNHAVCAPPVYDLIHTHKILTEVKYFAFESADCTSGVKQTAKGFDRDQIGEKFNTEDRIKYAIDKWEELTVNGVDCRSMQTICFAVDVAHADAIQIEFAERGYSAAVISYKQQHSERKPFFKDFENFNLQILISVDALSVGFDAPNIQCCLDMQPTTSTSRHWQKIGRIMRLFLGKYFSAFLDMVGNIERLGAFGIPEIVTLTPDLVLREKDYTDRPGEAPIKFCVTDSFGKGCFFVNYAGAKFCANPKCGKEFEKHEHKHKKILRGNLVAVIKPGMVNDGDMARQLLRSLRILRWNRSEDPNSSYFEYMADPKLGTEFPIVSPYEDRAAHKVLTLGSIKGDPGSIKVARAFFAELCKLAPNKTASYEESRFLIDLCLYLEFNDDIYVKMCDEWAKLERKQLRQHTSEGVEEMLVAG